jgi:hypothetical protein
VRGLWKIEAYWGPTGERSIPPKVFAQITPALAPGENQGRGKGVVRKLGGSGGSTLNSISFVRVT